MNLSYCDSMQDRPAVTSGVGTWCLRAFLAGLFAAAFLWCKTSTAAAERYSLWLTAHPRAIPADSHSSATISAELRNAYGAAVPDGTAVEFSTSLGVIEQRARTVGGVARVRLTSGTSVGTAVISAVAPDGGAVAELRVDFLEPGTQLVEEASIIVSSDGYLGYDGDKRIVDAAGGFRVEHRGLVIEAEAGQIDVRKGTLRAAGRANPITIKRGERQVNASAIYYDFGSMRGVILAPAEEGAARMRIRGADLLVQRDDSSDKDVKFDFVPISESKLFIRAKSIVIRPGEDVRFKRASYYIDGEKMGTVPLQVVPLRGGAMGTGRMLAYGTEGLRVDLPIYYSLTPNRAAAVRVRHSEATGWGAYSQRPGWQIDIDNDYNRGGSSQGLFSLKRVTSEDWGARWNHSVVFDDNSQIYSYLDFPGHRDLFGSLDYRKPIADCTWSFSLRGNKYRYAPDGYYAGAFLQSQVKPLFGDVVSFAYNTRTLYDSRRESSRKLGTGLGLQLYGKPVEFGRRASLNTSLSLARDWGSTDAGTAVYGQAGFSMMLGYKGYAGINYSYSWTDAYEGANSQRLSSTLTYRPAAKWAANLFATYGLTDSTASLFADASYSLSEIWRLGVMGTYQKYLAGNYKDMEYALHRRVGRQDISLLYSTSRQRFRLEMSAFGF